MSINTTDMANFINPLFITDMLNAYQGKVFIDSLFSDGLSAMDADAFAGGNFKMAAVCTNKYDGSATTIRVPIMPSLTGSITPVGEETGGEVEYDLTLGKCDITPVELGAQYIPVSGLCSLQFYNSAQGLALAACAGLAADTKERVIGSVITAGGTKQVSEAANSVMYWNCTPVDQGAGVYKPNADITAEDIKAAAAKLKGHAEPFEGGYLVGLIHPYALPSLLKASEELSDVQISQAAAGLGNLAKGYVGCYHGIAFFQCNNPYLYSATGGNAGTIGACKTVIFGRGWLAKGWVDPSALKPTDSGTQVIPFSDFQVRISADATDKKRRNSNASPYMVLNYAIADRTQGLYINHTIKEYEATSAASVA